MAGCVHEYVPPPPTPALPPEMSAPALTLLDYARRLADTSPQGRKAAVRAARHQVEAEPGAISYAYLALALGAPHQKLYTPDEAARYARLALKAQPAPWNPNARQYLSDCARLYALSSQASKTSDAEQRIADLETRLSIARDKLKALSNIEDRLDKVEDQP